MCVCVVCRPLWYFYERVMCALKKQQDEDERCSPWQFTFSNAPKQPTIDASSGFSLFLSLSLNTFN